MLEQKRKKSQISPHKSQSPEPHPHISKHSLNPFPLIHPHPHHHHFAATTTTTTAMAHHTTQRRILATSDPKPSMDPTHKKQHPKHTTDVRTSLKGGFMDTHLQAKAMSLFAMADSSKPNAYFSKTLPDVKSQNQGKEKSKKTSKGKDIKEKEKKESREVYDIKRLSSGAIVKIKEMNQSLEELEIKRPSVSLGRRRSFCGSQIELADFFCSNGARVVSVDMPPFMQIHAVDCARKAHDSLEKFTSKSLACTLKKEFDGVYGPAWHCIVGTSFGSFVTHSVGGFLYFSMDHKLYILLFKTTVQRAD